MKFAFYIVGLAVIGAVLVQFRADGGRVRHETLRLRNYSDIELPRQASMQDVEIAWLASFREVDQRVESVAAAAGLVDRAQRDALAKGLIAPEPARRVQTPPPARRETPPPQRNDRPMMRR